MLHKKSNAQYPVLPLRDIVMFPHMITSLFVGRAKSIKALEHAEKSGGEILLIAQKDSTKDVPKSSDLHKIGVLSKIVQISKAQEPTIQVFIQGIKRLVVKKFLTTEGLLMAYAEDFPDEECDASAKDIIVLRQAVTDSFEEYAKLMNKKINSEALGNITQTSTLEDFCNFVSSHIILSVQKKQELISINKLPEKLEKILLFINSEIEIMKAGENIKRRVRDQLEENQKKYYLNEQIKAIYKELGKGGEEDHTEEIIQIEKRIRTSKMNKEVAEKCKSELKKLKMMNPMSSEASVIRNYLDWVIELPWSKYSPTKKNLQDAENVLNQDHYGLEKVKERVLEYLAVNLRTNELKAPIICLVGPPGVGKTSLAESIARATGRDFVKVALGGLRDEAEIKGHRRTYIGAMPGKIIQALKKAKTSNPVILLDEIDKLSFDHRGDPASALLEVLDPSQNHKFNDHYIEVDVDLSKVMFIATANSTNLPRPLLDRLEVIKLSGYTEDEKMRIAIDYLIPKQYKFHSINNKEVTISDSAIFSIIRYYTREAGVRQLDRDIAKLMRKSIRKMMITGTNNIEISDDSIHEMLGVKKYKYGETSHDNRIGIMNGLAYTEVGGDLLEIEAVYFQGKGEMKITGKLGDVMKESIQAAVSFIRSKASDFGINPDLFKERDIHVHVPEGATPKDGPSAGVGMCIAIVSAMTGIPIHKDLAVTGENTLSGRVLPIGGLKEKLLAALRGGIKRVMIPKENEKDLEEIPKKVKDNLEIILLEKTEDAIYLALDGVVKKS